LIFSDETINSLQRDYEYLQTFLSTNVGDQEIVNSLNKSSSIQQIATIIDLLRRGDKSGTYSTCMKINSFFTIFPEKNSKQMIASAL
jgi:hypothetical protein